MIECARCGLKFESAPTRLIWNVKPAFCLSCANEIISAIHGRMHYSEPKRFFLYRLDDESGISGLGVVAEGIIFSTGKCALCWTTELQSVAVYDGLEMVEKIHGHSGKTIVFIVDGI